MKWEDEMWATNWISRKNPCRVPPPLVSQWLGNQRCRQNDGWNPEENPANNHANRFSPSWSRQDKFDQNNPIRPPTCFYCRKGHPISSCAEKWRVAQKQNSVEPNPNGFIIKTLSLSAVTEDTPPQVPRKKTQVSPMSEVSGSTKSFIDIFQPFIHDGSVSLSSDMSDSTQSKLERHWSLQVFTVEWHFVVFLEVVHWC